MSRLEDVRRTALGLTGRKQSQMGLQFHQGVGRLRLPLKNFGQSLLRIDAEESVQTRSCEIRVDQQDAWAGLGDRQSKVGRNKRFTVAGVRARDQNLRGSTRLRRDQDRVS